jgi:hypothetical protein
LREGWQWSSFFINCHATKSGAIDKKKRERTARPGVFHGGARPNKNTQVFLIREKIILIEHYLKLEYLKKNGIQN